MTARDERESRAAGVWVPAWLLSIVVTSAIAVAGWTILTGMNNTDRIGQLEVTTKQLSQQVNVLSDDVRSLTREIHQMNTPRKEMP